MLKRNIFLSQEKLMKEMHDKKLKLLIDGLKENKGNVWENKEKTAYIFQKFLSDGLKLEPDSINLVDIHRLPQRPLLFNGTRKTRPIIVKLSTAMKRSIFSALKNLKQFNEKR